MKTMKTFLWRIIDSEKAFRATLTAAMLVICAAMVSTVPTGCTTTGGGTNTFDVAKAAKAITLILGPVVVIAENADPETVVPFQDASAALGVLINNKTADVASLQKALSGISSNPLIQGGIALAISTYEITLADAVTAGVDQNATALTLLTAFKAALDQGVKAQAKRLAAHRPALRLK